MQAIIDRMLKTNSLKGCVSHTRTLGLRGDTISARRISETDLGTD